MTAGRAPLAGAPPVPELISIGYVLRPHGVRGEMVFVPLTDDPTLADGLVYLRPKNGGKALPFTVTGRRAHHGALLLSFRELADRTAAERYKSHTLLVPKERLPEPAADELYLSDLPGLMVQVPVECAKAPRSGEAADSPALDASGQFGAPGGSGEACQSGKRGRPGQAGKRGQSGKSGQWRDLGRIVSAGAPAGQVLWTISGKNGQEILFPAVEEFIVAIDLEAGTARIAPPPGLLDLYL